MAKTEKRKTPQKTSENKRNIEIPSHFGKKNKNSVEKKLLKSKDKVTKKQSNEQCDRGNISDSITLYQPTKEELLEFEKPENKKSILTKRQKKKQNHFKLLEIQKDQNESKDIIRNKEYLNKWKNFRKKWKFEKLRQISIQQSVFNEDKISDDIWPLALEYLSNSQGASRQQIIKIAEEVINELDRKSSDLSISSEEQQNIFSSTKYQRARELLQNLQ